MLMQPLQRELLEVHLINATFQMGHGLVGIVIMVSIVDIEQGVVQEFRHDYALVS